MRALFPLSLVLLLSACEGPQGPTGPQGPAGPPGPTPRPGEVYSIEDAAPFVYEGLPTITRTARCKSVEDTLLFGSCNLPNPSLTLETTEGSTGSVTLAPSWRCVWRFVPPASPVNVQDPDRKSVV